MPYRYTLGIKEPNRDYRIAKSVIAKNDTDLKKTCNVLLASKSKVTIIKKVKLQ